MGPQGVGKGTYAERLVQKYGIPAISTGDLFRENIRNNTEIGKKAKAYMDKGELVPDEITLEILKQRISKSDCRKGFFLDGFPRTAWQAEMLDKDIGVDKVLVFTAADDVIVDRISGRRICHVCNKIYHIKYIKPKVKGKCDIDGTELYQRKDDNEESIRRRLELYRKETLPVIKHYKKKKIAVEIDSPPIERINAVIDNVDKALQDVR